MRREEAARGRRSFGEELDLDPVPLLRQRCKATAFERLPRPRCDISGSRGVRVVRRGVRGHLAQLKALAPSALAIGMALACAVVASAATPAPAPQRIDVQKLQPKALAPTRALHVEYTVEINRLGQVTRVRAVKPSHDQGFDAHTYGNALQAFIRTPDGRVVLGTYRLTYDYDPKTLRVRRDVALVRAGGVNPNAKGAAVDMMEIAHRNGQKAAAATPSPGVIPSVNIRRMPDLPQVMHSPSPGPHG